MKLCISFFVGAFLSAVAVYLISAKTIEKEALGAFRLGIATGEAGYINLFSDRLKQGQAADSIVEFSICSSEYYLDLNYAEFRDNIMAGAAAVVVPVGIRNSLEYREQNGVSTYEECASHVKKKFGKRNST